MNSFIETLNQWGGSFLSFAWPIFWQSSLLIAMVLALDLLLAKKIRASIRYALWLAVLVKLLLPPTLALPTSAAWWLFRSQPAVVVPAKQYVITDGATTPPADFVPPTFPVSASAPKLGGAGGAFLGSVTVSAGLLLWLGFRWRRVMRKVRGATVSPEFAGPLEAAQQMAGLRSGVRLKIVDGQLSPAVCGLFRPVILLPRTLVEKLSAGQLRTVLLHELFHLRRKDVWVNCAQALLQILYWWHPLLWLANARIRRVREEAVDDAVMLALRDEAEDYAPTLLEVARLAFRRPRLSLGLVGIMESRSALRQRIERLVNFRAPRKAGLTVASLCGIFVFSALALPMGQAPAEVTSQTSPATGYNLNQANPGISTAAILSDRTNAIDEKAEADQLVRDGKLLYEMGKFDEAEACLREVLARDPENPAAHYYLNLVQASKAAGPGSQRIQAQNRRKQIVEMLNRIRFDQFGPNNRWPLKEVVRELNQLSAGFDSDKAGIRFSTADNADGRQPKIDPNTGLPAKASSSNGTDINSVIIMINQTLTNVTLANVLDAIVMTANKPIEYAISEDGVVFALGNGREAPRLYSRVFNLNNDAFLANLRKRDSSKTNVTTVVRQLCLTAGVELTPPKSIFYNDRMGLLFVRATEPDLDKVEKVLETLNCLPPQIHIKARFLKVPNGTLDGFGSTKITGSTNEPDQFVGILTSENTQAETKALESRAGVEELAEPEATTTSGRQMEMRATETITIITNFAYRETMTNSIIFPQTNAVETGPILSTMATVLPDGDTVDLDAKVSLTEFLGYAVPTHTTATNNSAGEKIDLPGILPRLRVRQASTHVNLYDGQTLLLGRIKNRTVGADNVPESVSREFKTEVVGVKDIQKPDSRELLVFVTVNLVDSAGNRLHSDQDMPFARNAIPQQNGP